jgi:hypothetical protein
VTLLVELSSLFGQLTAGTLFAGWMLVCLALFFGAAMLARKRGVTGKDALACGRQWVLGWKDLAGPTDSVFVWFCVAVFVLLLGVIALEFPATTGDSLTYHLARIMHWMQDQHVAHYPTHNCRQNELAPWSEFATVTLHLLWGSDRLVNLVQWFAMLSCVVTAPFIALQLMDARAQAEPSPQSPTAVARRHRLASFTALLVVTLPISIVEAVTTQTDYTTTFWLVGLVCLGLALAQKPRQSWYALGAGLAFSLGVLTKATMVLYAGPALLALAWWLWSRANRWRLAVLFSLSFIVLNAGHAWRNYSLVKSPLAGPTIHRLVTNNGVSLGGTVSNVIRNIALETTTPFKSVNGFVNGRLAWLHQLTGQNLNDPDTTYELCVFRWPETLQIYDSQAPNPFHFLLILVAAGLALARFRRNRGIVGCAVLLGVSFVLFCALLRWQEWHSRMHLPYFVLLMPLVAIVLTTEMVAGAVVGIGCVALLVGIHTFANNESRPLWDPTFTRIPREAQYLAIHGPHFYESYLRSCNDVSASLCTNVGLKLQYGDFEYAFWVMLKDRGFNGRLDHVFVEDVSRGLPTNAPPPCVIITTFDPPPAEVTAAFPRRKKYPYVSVCWPEVVGREAEKPK